MDGQTPNRPLYSVIQQVNNAQQNVGRDWAVKQQEAARLQRAAEVAGRLAMEQTTQR
jgi:hypothetical protein